jgi:hypothetical protein
LGSPAPFLVRVEESGLKVEGHNGNLIFLVYGFACVFLFDQSFGLTAEHFEGLPIVERRG